MFQVNLPDGRSVWFTGDTISDAICNGMKRYGGVFAQPRETRPSTPIFKAYAEKWFALYHTPKVKPNTANNARIILHKHIYPAMGELRLDEITPDEIQTFFNSRMYLCRSTMQKMKILLHQIFQSALEDGYIQRNPAASTRLAISKKVTARTALSLHQIDDIIRQLPMLSDHDRMFIMLPLYTGMRRSEALGLQWNDIDYERRQIHIQRGVTFTGNRPVIGPPKSKAGFRAIPLLPALEAYLREVRPQGDYLIGGEHPITEQTYKRAWERISRTIDLYGATAHVFRHTFATLAVPYVDVKTLQSIMGHADIETTMNRYAHPQSERILSARARLSAMFSAQAEPDMGPDIPPSPQTLERQGVDASFCLPKPDIQPDKRRRFRKIQPNPF